MTDTNLLKKVADTFKPLVGTEAAATKLNECIHDRNAVEAGMRFFRLCPRRRRFDMAAGGGCSGSSAGCSTSPGLKAEERRGLG